MGKDGIGLLVFIRYVYVIWYNVPVISQRSKAGAEKKGHCGGRLELFRPSLTRILLFCLRTFAGAWNKPAQEHLDCWRWIDEQVYDQVFFVFNFQEVVDRFGRFPQRNKVLGRENTPEEEEWLNNLPDKFKWWNIHRVLLNCPLILVIHADQLEISMFDFFGSTNPHSLNQLKGWRTVFYLLNFSYF